MYGVPIAGPAERQSWKKMGLEGGGELKEFNGGRIWKRRGIDRFAKIPINFGCLHHDAVCGDP
ncbi:MAG: hypothetical protein A4C66_00005 [Nitrospira sp. HN-bin3]|nr:MAG: hypothetical protein A4C66_00005 [Nitrospira sp. HN-bin3]